MSKRCIECGELLTVADKVFVENREMSDMFSVRLFDHDTCKSCITLRETHEDESLETKDDPLGYKEVYSDNLDQEVLEAENTYQGYDSLGKLDGTEF